MTNEEIRERETRMARQVILAQNGLLPGKAVGQVQDDYDIEEAKYDITSTLHRLEARIGQPATKRFIDGLYSVN
jgi:hypothetical protein